MHLESRFHFSWHVAFVLLLHLVWMHDQFLSFEDAMRGNSRFFQHCQKSVKDIVNRALTGEAAAESVCNFWSGQREFLQVDTTWKEEYEGFCDQTFLGLKITSYIGAFNKVLKDLLRACIAFFLARFSSSDFHIQSIGVLE